MCTAPTVWTRRCPGTGSGECGRPNLLAPRTGRTMSPAPEPRPGGAMGEAPVSSTFQGTEPEEGTTESLRGATVSQEEDMGSQRRRCTLHHESVLTDSLRGLPVGSVSAGDAWVLFVSQGPQYRAPVRGGVWTSTTVRTDVHARMSQRSLLYPSTTGKAWGKTNRLRDSDTRPSLLPSSLLIST